MGKGKRKGNESKKSKAVDNEYSDNDIDYEVASCVSQVGSCGEAPYDEVYDESSSAADMLSEHIDNLNEKKSATRMQALNGTLKCLQSNCDVSDSVRGHMETLNRALVRLIRSASSEKEGILAVQILCVLALEMGPDEDSFFEAYFPALKYAITRSEYHDLRCWAVKAVSFVCFICASDGYDALNFCEEVISQASEGVYVPTSLQAVALQAWCLLSSTMPPDVILQRCKNSVFARAAALLEESETEHKIISGGCLAYMWEIADKVAPNVSTDVSGGLLCDDPTVVDSALDSIRQIIRDSSKRVSKRDKKERKAALKSVEDWILHGFPPSESVRMIGADVTVNSFTEILVLSTLRDVLKDGFHSALKCYPVVRDILEVEYVDPGDIEAAESRDDMRFMHSYRNKLRNSHRRQQRADKHLSHGGSGFE
mmetsp:Transcript_15955/g.24042  ORF Transcript_15955/g.24042 Transcript_15955/m.24042 type:complete len:426 (+) Transcript_15955:139-1416(+)|eukprot:CAMPEP_0185017472 /NCGR_PEP_ID=MMETSP1103-20130426/419_1 /TAXON_ID=36769 /ORGANISM="Paraphysomonas bandaiensis, Strain Caron Lab Isolate" /LENGTH=425 /DNA_ID=CAMNT_0027546897 /DNA_START=68 /DNA_END=1345 /DNA_ORIENTATION=-